MLTAIREGSKGWIAYIVIGLIVLTFALFGISSYLEGGSETPIATVNGEEIDLYTYQNELARQRQALLSRFGSDFDPALLDSLGIKDRVIEGLVESRLLAQYASDRNYRLSDSQLAQRIQGNAMFETDGKFDPARYASILESSRMTPQSYEAMERQGAAVGQLQEAIQESAFTIENEVDRLVRLENQRREVRYTTIPAASYVDEFDISEEAAREEYEDNIDRYQRDARIKVNYIDLDVDRLAESVDPTEDDIEQTYQRLKGRFITPEVRKVSHILFAADSSGDAAADEAARTEQRARAEETLAELESGADFAALAEQRSDDAGSAASGGDLGVVARDQMVKPFEDAVYALNEGEHSEIVETQFGFHLIKLTELVDGEQQPLEEVRDEIIAEARKATSEATFADLVEPFQSLIFEQPDSLEPAADELGLKIETSDWFSQAEGQGIASESAVRRAAFGEDVLEGGLNSQPIELGFDRMVALRKMEYEAASPKSFEEVEDQIVRDLKLEKSRARVEEVATEALQGLTDAASFDTMVANNGWQEKTLSPRRSEIEPRNAALAEVVYAEPVPDNDKPQFGQVELPGGDVALYALLEVEAGDPDSADDAVRNRIARQLESRDGAGAYRRLMTYLRDQAEVVIDSSQL